MSIHKGPHKYHRYIYYKPRVWDNYQLTTRTNKLKKIGHEAFHHGIENLHPFFSFPLASNTKKREREKNTNVPILLLKILPWDVVVTVIVVGDHHLITTVGQTYEVSSAWWKTSQWSYWLLLLLIFGWWINISLNCRDGRGGWNLSESSMVPKLPIYR